MKNFNKLVPLAILLFVLAPSSKILMAQHSHGGSGRGSNNMSGHGNHVISDQKNKDDVDSGDVKMVVVDNIQAAFEIYSKAKYNEMADSMKVRKVHADNNSSHFIIISLMNRPDMKQIKNASIEVELMSPYTGSAKKKAYAMEGGGMFHYAVDFTMNTRGTYKVSAVINIDGKDLKAETDFTIKK